MKIDLTRKKEPLPWDDDDDQDNNFGPVEETMGSPF